MREETARVELTYWQLRNVMNSIGSSARRERKNIERKTFVTEPGQVDLRVRRAISYETAYAAMDEAMERRWPGRVATDDAIAAEKRAAKQATEEAGV